MTDLWMVIFGGDGGRISANFTWWNVGVASTFILVNGKTATKTSHAAIVESCIHAIDSDYFGHDAIKTGDSTHCQLRTMHTSAQCYGTFWHHLMYMHLRHGIVLIVTISIRA